MLPDLGRQGDYDALMPLVDFDTLLVGADAFALIRARQRGS